MLTVVGPSLAGPTATIRNIPPTPHHAPAGTPLADLAAAIRLAVDEQGWRVIAQAPAIDDAILYAEIDLNEVPNSHAKRHFLIDRRPELYGAWLK